MSGEGTTSISAEVRRAADRFSERLAARDPELMAKLAEMRGKKFFVAVPPGFHDHYLTASAGAINLVLES